MVMLRSEDGVHGFSINGRTAPHEFTEHPDVTEPVDEETARVNANDKLVKDYMKNHDHYECAYNALEWRERALSLEKQLASLAADILGLEHGAEISKDAILRAKTERGRLLASRAVYDNSIATMTELVSRLQHTNNSMVKEVLEGRAAKDELVILASRFGVKVDPGDSAITISHKIQMDRFAGTIAKPTQ